MYQLIGLIFLLSYATSIQANVLQYKLLFASTTTVIHQINSDQAIPHQASSSFITDGQAWLTTMSSRVKRFIPDQKERDDFLSTVYYEAIRAGLDPQLVLSVIQVESNFNKYAISSAGARGYMQIMPFWVDTIGTKDHNLFHLRVNLRYGCTILRHYLEIEKGNYFRALGRYNGSLGQVTYPQQVFNTWRETWAYPS
ncbi:MAG: lytic transglycosylase domain-containing protein [Nitrosomonas sp.]|nr:lytic transglycosylase domain-containing protein [Nitrosomonas sp.]MDP1951488.1 lytic transglycosylase domain-containing protein [Nitrosomonas sp.]